MPPKRGSSSGPKPSAKGKAKAKAKAAAEPEDPRKVREREAEEVFERYEPEGKMDGALNLKEFMQVMRDVNTKKLMVFGDDPGPTIGRQEWKKFAEKRRIELEDFKAWWPDFCEMVDKAVEERDAEAAKKSAEAAAANADKVARCTGDGVWSIPMGDLQFAMQEAYKKGKTPLIIDNTPGFRVEAFILYSGAHIVEMKKMVMDKAKGGMKVEEILEDARDQFFSARAFKFGVTVAFRMANSAADIKGCWSNEIFPVMSLLDAAEVKKVLGMENAKAFETCPFAKMCPKDDFLEHAAMGVHENFNVIVITQFDEKDYAEFLGPVLPMELLQPIKPMVD